MQVPALALTLAAVPALPSSAQPPQLPLGDTLLKDLNPEEFPGKWHALPWALVETPAFTLFAAAGNADGGDYEPWITDGTPAGTFQLGEIVAGPQDGSMFSAEAVQRTPMAAEVPGGVVFRANDGAHGHELWRTDGTWPGTALLLDLRPGAASSAPRYFRKLAGTVYFLAQGDLGTDLWTTDGTAAGTGVVAPMGLSPTGRLAAEEGRLWLTDFDPGAQTSDLWVSDGTPPAATFVRSFQGQVIQSDLRTGAGVGGRYVFGVSASPGTDGGVWASEGSPAGTRRLAAAESVRWIERLGDRVIFAVEVGSGPNLFASDGTPQGTVPLGSFAFTFTGSFLNPSAPAAVGGLLVFGAAGPEGHGAELYRTDGTPAGTFEVADLAPGTAGSEPLHFIARAGVAFFTAIVPGLGRELWRTDGTAAGTRLVLDLEPGPAGTTFDNLISWMRAPAGLVFPAAHGVDGMEPFVTDGTAAGTAFLKEVNPEWPAGSDVRLMTRVGLRAVFGATDPEHGPAVFVTDGTAGGTVLLKDLAPADPALGGPIESVSLGGIAVLVGGPPGARELWATDGTPEGTVLLLDLLPGSEVSPQLTAAGDQVFFVADDGVHGEELWRTDGTAAGTYLVQDVWVGSDVHPNIVGATQELVFLERGSAIAHELVVSDGTPAGTHAIDLPGSSPLDGGQGFGDLFAFPWDDGVHGREVWITDGTQAGTQILIDLVPGPTGSAPGLFSRVGSRLLFAADDGVGSPRDVWSSDGTPGGTREILTQTGLGEIPAFVPDAGPYTWIRLGASAPASLWRTDGTKAGTVLMHVFDPLHPVGDSTPGEAGVGAEGFLAFTARNALGRELWISGLAPGGAFQVADSNPGPAHGNPDELLLLGPTLLFRAFDDVHGEELHAIPLAAAGTFEAQPYGEGCSSSSAPAELGFTGHLSVGASATIELSGAPSAALAPLFLAPSPASVALGGGCTGLLASPHLTATAAADPAGAASFPVSIPASPGLAGVALYLQAAVVEPGGPLLGAVGLSRGLQVVLGP